MSKATNKIVRQKYKYFYFLVAAAFLVIAGLVLKDAITEHVQNVRYNDIYNKLPCYVYNIKVELIYEYTGGCNTCAGVSKNGYLFLPAHCLSRREFLGPYEVSLGKLISRKIYVDDVLISNKRMVHVDEENDVAVYLLPEDMNNKRDFPCEISKEVNMGEQVFLIGTFKGSGLLVRKVTVSSLALAGPKNAEYNTMKTFWIDGGGYPGESGSPVVTSDYKLVGLVACSLNPSLMGVKYIDEYARNIE